MKFHRLVLSFVLPSALAISSGCKDKEEIKVYRVSKESAESTEAAPFAKRTKTGAPSMGAGMPAMSGMPGTDPHAVGAGMGGGAEQASQVTSQPPGNWEAQPLSSMRQASYLVRGENGAIADISIVFLEGVAGGVLDNVNRWLGQLGQPAIDQEKFNQISSKIPCPLGEVILVDLEGLPQGADPARDGRIVAGILSKPDQTVFFKMRGNAALAASQKEAFKQWIGTVKMAGGAATSAPAGAQSGTTPPAGMGNDPHAGMATNPHAGVAKDPHAGIPNAPAMGGMGSASSGMGGMNQPVPGMGSAVDADKPQWVVPSNWQSMPASSMRVASFSVPGQNGQALDISVSNLAGDGGGDLLNVNRWRQQLSLAPTTEEEVKKQVSSVKAKDAEIAFLDLTGPSKRMLVGWTRMQGKTWFFKLNGPDSLVASEKEHFTQFLQSLQFHQ